MGRRKVISPWKVLEAAEVVVMRDGAAGVSLEAVAEQAEVSKASILYDFRSKEAFLEAVVDRAVARDNRLNSEMTEVTAVGPNRMVEGRIITALQPPPEQPLTAAHYLCAAFGQFPNLRKPMQETYGIIVQQIARLSPTPRGTVLAHLALEGLKLIEALGYYRWSPDERLVMLRDMLWLSDARPPRLRQAPLRLPRRKR